MPYSLDQAKVLLQTTERTPQALLNLVRQISVEATGSITVFYGGNLPDGSNATAVIGKMVAAPGSAAPGSDTVLKVKPISQEMGVKRIT